MNHYHDTSLNHNKNINYQIENMYVCSKITFNLILIVLVYLILFKLLIN